MKSLSWQKSYTLKYSERDGGGRLKASVFLGMLEDLAWEAADRLGFGYSDVARQNTAWFLLKYRMEFSSYPASEESLLIKTEARGLSRLFALRDFTVFTSSGLLLARVSSTWGLIDLKSGGMVRPDSIFPWMPALQKREDDLRFAQLKALEKPNLQKSFRVRYDDIDINRHVNNASYLAWALDTLDPEFREGHGLKAIDILFKKEAKISDIVLSEALFLPESLTGLHTLKNESSGDLLSLIKTEFY